MKIWVDADACPVVIKEVIFRAADRAKIQTTFVANHYIRTPKSRYIQFKQVTSGFDVADDAIVELVEHYDLVITSDIPLAAEVIEKGAFALSSRGELFTTANIKARLNIRDFMDTMRASGVQTEGPAKISQNDRMQFANHLDSLLQKHHVNKPN